VRPDGVVLEEVDPNEPVYCHCQRVCFVLFDMGKKQQVMM
jgi:hypothetical protein